MEIVTKIRSVFCDQKWSVSLVSGSNLETLAAQTLLRNLSVDFFLNAARPIADPNGASSSGGSDEDVVMFATSVAVQQEADQPRMTKEQWEQAQTPNLRPIQGRIQAYPNTSSPSTGRRRPTSMASSAFLLTRTRLTHFST